MSGYDTIRAVNFSTLKELERSPAHYAHRLTHPRADTPAMRLGRAVHTAVLEPERFADEVVVFDGATRRGKAWDEFASTHEAHTILKADEHDVCCAIRDAVRGHAVAGPLLAGDSEVTVEWDDPATGLPCKGRIDHLDGDAVFDLKTTGTIDAWAFEAHSARMLYHAQLALYARGVSVAHGITGVTATIIAVESEPPHDVAVFDLTDEALVVGAAKCDEWLARLVECRDSGTWPGRYADRQELTVPGWLSLDPDSGLGIRVGGEVV